MHRQWLMGFMIDITSQKRLIFKPILLTTQLLMQNSFFVFDKSERHIIDI